MTSSDSLPASPPTSPSSGAGPGTGDQGPSLRRRVLLTLWLLTAVLLAGQLGLALYLTARTRGEVAPSGSPSQAVHPASARRPTPDAQTPLASAVASADARPDVLGPLAPQANAHRPGAAGEKPSSQRARRTPPHGRRASAARPEESDQSKVVSSDIAIPAKQVGNAARGERLFRMGCGLCHGRSAKAIQPTALSARGWRAFFASGRHGAHDELSPHFTRAELADVKAYLMSSKRAGD